MQHAPISQPYGGENRKIRTDPFTFQFYFGQYGNAGSIVVLARDCNGGRFRVHGNYSVMMFGYGAGQQTADPIYAKSVLREGLNGKYVPGFNLLYATKSIPFVLRYNVPFSVDVQLAPSKPEVVVTHEVILQFPSPKDQNKGPSYGWVWGRFDGVHIDQIP